MTEEARKHVQSAESLAQIAHLESELAKVRKEKVEKLETELTDLRNEFTQYKIERAKDDARRMRAALMTVGGALLAVVGWVFHEFLEPIITRANHR